MPNRVGNNMWNKLASLVGFKASDLFLNDNPRLWNFPQQLQCRLHLKQLHCAWRVLACRCCTLCSSAHRQKPCCTMLLNLGASKHVLSDWCGCTGLLDLKRHVSGINTWHHHNYQYGGLIWMLSVPSCHYPGGSFHIDVIPQHGP